MNNNYTNIMKQKRLEWYNSLSKEQQKKIDSLHDEKADKSNYMIKSIKRKRNPQVKEGDIFAIYLPEGGYMFGRVIKAAIEDSDRRKRLCVIFIFNKVSDNMNDVPVDLNYDLSVIGPLIADVGFWTRGYFYNISNSPLSETEKELDYGFYNDKIFSGNYCDVYANEINYKPQFLSIFAHTTLYGVSMAIREKIILNEICYVSNSEMIRN